MPIGPIGEAPGEAFKLDGATSATNQGMPVEVLSDPMKSLLELVSYFLINAKIIVSRFPPGVYQQQETKFYTHHYDDYNDYDGDGS